MKQPQLGDVVIYNNLNGNQCPAVIVKVWSTQCVNLRLLQDAPPSISDYVTSVMTMKGQGTTSWEYPESRLQKEIHEIKNWIIGTSDKITTVEGEVVSVVNDAKTTVSQVEAGVAQTETEVKEAEQAAE